MIVTDVEFLEPTRNREAFEPVCRRLVLEGMRRNFQVPGVEFKLARMGRGDQQFGYVREIRGPNFRVEYFVHQGRAGAMWWNPAGAGRIVISGWEMVLDDMGGNPMFYRYAGTDWQADQAAFLDSLKGNGSVKGIPGPYLVYAPEHYVGDGRIPCYMALDDQKVAHLPGPFVANAQRRITSRSVFNSLAAWLEDDALSLITASPVAETDVNPFFEQPEPLPTGFGPLYLVIGGADARRIMNGQVNRAQLEPQDRYALSRPTCGLSEIPAGSHPYDIAGAVFAGTGAMEKEYYVVAVEPGSANHITIFDHGAFERRRRQIFDEVKPRDMLTHQEHQLAVDAEQATTVPIAEYPGGFGDARVKIEREVGLGEVRILSGPWPFAGARP
jgi:hypothetical protein